MATISTLAIRIITQHSPALAGIAAVASASTQLAATVVQNSTAMRAANTATATAGATYNATAGEVAKFTGKLLGVATVAGATSKAIKMSATEEMRTSYERLATAVDGAFKVFGDGFSRSAGLVALLDAATVAVRNLSGVLNVLGTAMGTVFSWVARFTPVIVALGLALKILTGVALFYVQYVITKWIIKQATLLLLGHQMTSVQLLMAAGAWAMSAAYSAAATACGLLSAAMTALMTIGLPLWAALAIVALVVAAALAVLVGLAYGLYKAWQYFTSNDADDEKIAKLDEMQKKMQALSQEAGAMVDDVQKKIDQFGMSDMEKSIDDFTRKFADLRQSEGDTAFQERLEVYQKALQQLEAMEAAAKREKEVAAAALEAFKERQRILAETVTMQNALNTKLDQMGWTEQQKALNEFVTKLDEANLLTDKQRQAAIAQFSATQQQIAAAEQRLEIEKTIAGLEAEAAQAGMTAAQQKIAALQAMGATAEQIAQAQAAINAKTAAEEKKSLVDRGNQMKESLATPMEKYQQQIDEINRLLAAGAIDPQTAMRAADAAAKTAEDAFSQGGRTREVASPQALLKGSAEAALAADRHKNNPQDKMLDVQKKQFAEIQRMHQTQRDILKEQQSERVFNIN